VKDYNSNILITGHRGYIGSALCKKLECLNNYSVRLFIGDVSSREDWITNLDKIDIVFHLAAIEYNATKDPYDDLSINGMSILNLLEACKLKNISPKIVFASSSNIFGKTENLPALEKHKDTPQSVWSAHKLLAENYLSIYSAQLQLTAVSLRLSNVFGPSTSKELSRRMSLNKMIETAVKKGTINLFNNSECVRDWVYIDDVITALLLALKLNTGRYHNFLIGGENNKSIRQTADIIIGKVGQNLGISVKINDMKDIQLSNMAMRNYFPSCALFKDATGWDIVYDLESGIELTVAYFHE
jgi:nucleoside-diphosphate-sugar epimerase